MTSRWEAVSLHPLWSLQVHGDEPACSFRRRPAESREALCIHQTWSVIP